MRNRIWLLLAIPLCAAAQEQPDYRQILERLEKLEEQNRELLQEIREIREQLAHQAQPPVAPASEPRDTASAGVARGNSTEPLAAGIAERVGVIERRTDELDQTKVQAEHRYAIHLTGTMLFNAYLNGRANGDQGNPTTASLQPATALGGATLRQSILGLTFDGPTVAGGGRVNGSLYMDFFAGTGTSLNQLMRLRVATLAVDWKNTSISFGQDKPLIAPRDPDSLAQVGVSPLTGAGNLWLWLPQLRVERRFPFSDQTGVRAQFSVIQTSETGTGVTGSYLDTLSRARPGAEGRLEFWAERGDRRVELASGMHVSSSHLEGQSVPSRVYSVDWLVRPLKVLDFTGTLFAGENVDVLGGLRQGIQLFNDTATAVHASGGWAQLTWRATPRLSFHVYGGQEAECASELQSQSIARNSGYAANIMYRLGPNVLTSFEVSQVRTEYLRIGTRLNPHYDLAFAYLF